MSEETMRQVDQEIRRIVDEQYAIAQRILEDNRDKMETMCQALMDWETIDADQVKEIMAGKQPSPPKDFIKSLMNTLEETVSDASNTNATPPEVPSSEPSQTGKTE